MQERKIYMIWESNHFLRPILIISYLLNGVINGASDISNKLPRNNPRKICAVDPAIIYASNTCTEVPTALEKLKYLVILYKHKPIQ